MAYTSTRGRSAADINFENAVRYRQKQTEANLLGQDPGGSVAIAPGWDAFHGGLDRAEEDATANGMGFRADLSGIGQFDDPRARGRLTSTDRAGIAGNIALGNLTDQSAVQQLKLKAAADQQRDAAIEDAKKSYADQVAASFLPPPRAHVQTETDAANGTPEAYTLRPAVAETDRERLLASLPPPARAAYEAQFAAQDLAERKQTEAERAAKANEAIAGASTLSADAVDQNARQYLQTGVMPVLGMKDPGNRQKILNRAAEIGQGGNVAANKADYKADSASLTKLQQQRDAVGAFEDTALKNLDVFMDAAKKVPDTGSPLLNHPLRAIDEKALGSADLAAYNAARRTVVPEFAKILSNPTLAGQLSDSARKEVEDVVSGDATLAQTIAVANVLKTDAANRRTSYDDQLKTVHARIGKGGQPAAPAAGASGGASDYRKKYNY